MPLPVTTACPVGPAATAATLPSPLGTILSPAGTDGRSTDCAIRKLAASRTRRKAKAYFVFPRGVFILHDLNVLICCVLLNTEEARKIVGPRMNKWPIPARHPGIGRTDCGRGYHGNGLGTNHDSCIFAASEAIICKKDASRKLRTLLFSYQYFCN